MSIYRFGFRLLRTPTGGLASDPSCCCNPCDKFLCEDDGYCCCLECADKQTPIVQVDLNDICLPTVCTPTTGPCVGDEPEPHNPTGGYFKATQAMLDATMTLVRVDCCAWYGVIEMPVAGWYADDSECGEAEDQYTTLEVTLRYYPDGATGGPLRLLSAVLTGTTAVPADVFFRLETRPNRYCEPAFVMSNEITDFGCKYDSARYGPYLYTGGRGGTATVTPCGDGGGVWMGCCDEKPSMVRRAAAMAASGAVGLVRVGLRIGLAPPREIERRRAVCRECDIAVKDPSTGRAKWCGRLRDAARGKTAGCGCLLAAKTQLIDAECPIGKWGSWGRS